MPYKRIMIFGLPGSGKSTFANKLGALLALPVHHLDKYFFTKNWVERDAEEFLKIQEGFVSKDKWIIEGNAIHSLEMRMARADTAVYFHYPRPICLWRVFKRIFFYNKQIQDRAEGCSPSFGSKLLSYLWSFDKRAGPVIRQLRKKYPGVAFHVIQSDKELHAFLEQLY